MWSVCVLDGASAHLPWAVGAVAVSGVVPVGSGWSQCGIIIYIGSGRHESRICLVVIIIINVELELELEFDAHHHHRTLSLSLSLSVLPHICTDR